MSDRLGLSLSAGKTRIPASFHGTMRLVDEHEVPAGPQKISGLDMLPGEFQTKIDITFGLLLKLGFVPVDPTHPSYPLYRDALAAHDTAAQAEQDVQPLLPDSLAAHFIRMPFQTTFPLTAEMWLRYGLVPPGPDAGAAQDLNNGQAASRRDAMPPRPSPPGSSAPDLSLHRLADPGAPPVGGKRDHQFPWAPAQKLFLPDRTGNASVRAPCPGTTGNRVLDVVFNAGRIPPLHRASPAPAKPGDTGEDRALLQPAVAAPE